jgi:hypothetical protein
VKVKRQTRPVDKAEWNRHLNERLRAEYIAGAEEEWRRRTGQAMTAAELERVLRRYPGDLNRLLPGAMSTWRHTA